MDETDEKQGVARCHMCESHPAERQAYGRGGLKEGIICPICFRPTCRFHLATVRWRWRESGELDSALVCKDCVRTYAHRDWDKYHRDWIT